MQQQPREGAGAVRVRLGSDLATLRQLLRLSISLLEAEGGDVSALVASYGGRRLRMVPGPEVTSFISQIRKGLAAVSAIDTPGWEVEIEGVVRRALVLHGESCVWGRDGMALWLGVDEVRALRRGREAELSQLERIVGRIRVGRCDPGAVFETTVGRLERAADEAVSRKAGIVFTGGEPVDRGEAPDTVPNHGIVPPTRADRDRGPRRRA